MGKGGKDTRGGEGTLEVNEEFNRRDSPMETTIRTLTTDKNNTTPSTLKRTLKMEIVVTDRR